MLYNSRREGVLSMRKTEPFFSFFHLTNIDNTMKKTLIALMALAGLAMADMVQLSFEDGRLELVSSVSPATQNSGNEAISFNTTLTQSPSTGLTDYILTFQFTAITSVNTDAFIRVNGFDHLSVRGNDQGAIFISNGAGNATPLGGTLTPDTTSTFALTVSGSNNVAYLSNLSTGDVVTLNNLSTTFTNVSDYAFKSGNARVWTNGAAEKMAFGQIANLTMMSEEQVLRAAKTGIIAPEPATATLSLLALAGLAARRRRH